MNTLNYILQKFNISPDSLRSQRMPIDIPNFGREDLARLFCELGFKKGTEIGVEQGVYTEVLCRENPQSMIYAIDAWQAYRGYRDHVSQDKLDDFYESTQARLKPYNNHSLVRAFSISALQLFNDASLDFVYIDANHELPFVINDIIEWSKKVRSGGIISGHDYKENKRLDSRCHVVHAVNAYTGAYKIKPWFLLGTRNIVEGETRDRPRSWMWVKE